MFEKNKCTVLLAMLLTMPLGFGDVEASNGQFVLHKNKGYEKIGEDEIKGIFEDLQQSIIQALGNANLVTEDDLAYINEILEWMSEFLKSKNANYLLRNNRDIAFNVEFWRKCYNTMENYISAANENKELANCVAIVTEVLKKFHSIDKTINKILRK